MTETFLSTSRILIVEGEVLVAMSLEDIVGNWGCTDFRTANNHHQALEAIKAYAPTLVVLDPERDGRGANFLVADALLAQGTAFIFSSGQATDSAPPRHLSRTVVTRPFIETALLAALQDCVGHHPAGRA